MDPYNGIVGSLVKYIFKKILKKAASGLPETTKEAFAKKILYNPDIVEHISKVENKVHNQAEVGSLMMVQEIIGLIPIPELPDVINGAIDLGYQGVKSVETALQAKDTLMVIAHTIETDPVIKMELKKNPELSTKVLGTITSELKVAAGGLNKLSILNKAIPNAISTVTSTIKNVTSKVKGATHSVAGGFRRRRISQKYRKTRRPRRTKRTRRTRRTKRTKRSRRTKRTRRQHKK